MGNAKTELLDGFKKSMERLRTATSYQVSRTGEPFRIMQSMLWDSMILRAQVTALTDMMSRKGGLDSAEFQHRTAHFIDKYTQILSEQMGIHILDNGQVVEGAKSQTFWKS